MFFLRKSSLYSKQNKISCSDKSNQADNERNLSYHIQASSDHNIYITGRIIISKGECFTSQISLSAIILTLLEASPMQNYNKFYGSHSFFLSGSNDHTTKFWCRNRPGDPVKDKLGSYLQGCLFQGSYTLSQMLHSCP